jgi:anti-sigma factor (TIGR02949 family)
MTAMSCADAQRRFFTYLDRALGGEDAEALEAHLEACIECCDRLEFGRRLDAFVRSRLGEAFLPPGLAERVQRALAAAAPAAEEK